MPTPKGNSNVTKKGTKQRSFNLDDATFAIVEAEAARLHITNSAALSSILNRSDTVMPIGVRAPRETADQTQQRHEEAGLPARDLSHLIPSETATNFEVNDPANDSNAKGKPSVRRTRSKLDNKLSDVSEVDILRGPKDD